MHLCIRRAHSQMGGSGGLGGEGGLGGGGGGEGGCEGRQPGGAEQFAIPHQQEGSGVPRGPVGDFRADLSAAAASNCVERG
jgi:hypothetical protein